MQGLDNPLSDNRLIRYFLRIKSRAAAQTDPPSVETQDIESRTPSPTSPTDALAAATAQGHLLDGQMRRYHFVNLF